MDDYQHFQDLAFRPHTKTSLALMSAATRVAHKRFGNFRCTHIPTDSANFPSYGDVAQEDAQQPVQDLMGEVDGTWAAYAARLSHLECPAENSKITQSMWTLVRGGFLDMDIVKDYLHLLRPTSRHVDIASPRIFHWDDACIDETQGMHRPIIIPFLIDRNWAFAVAYSDCIHWYDSIPDRNLSLTTLDGTRPVVEGRQGPHCDDPADAGILMLMGIKLILQRKPHLGQRVASDLIQSFRSRLFAELLCRKIEPTNADLHRAGLQLASEPDEVSAFIDGGGQRLVSDNDGPDGPSLFEPMIAAQPTFLEPFIVQPAAESIVQDEIIVVQPDIQLENSVGTSTRQSRDIANTSRKRALDHGSDDMNMVESAVGHVDDRIIILENLSHAIHFKRSALASSEDDPFVLWVLLKYSKASGILHRRYHAVLLHDMMKNSRTTVSKLPRKATYSLNKDLWSWKFWKEVSDIGVDHGLGPLVPLFAFPSTMTGYRLSQRERDRLIKEFRRRLEDQSDALYRWLGEASRLCRLILVGSTPVHLFNIDKYDAQGVQVISDGKYKFYVKADPIQPP